ncbi:SCO2584 family spore wall biosynthesis protein [Streptomyces cinnamoneus]|uniref:Uncharacterized protein n=1 Tax=Streptomyces cinnamoneus TaxID=53446 RepID=A0A918WH41_STRCJ|nr:hypothetical protein [Streptomyces cinnamoneus]GHC51038.1 hypothetical protein GCM10010507_28600 [Streptomyces cinnamoneus]
MPDDVGGRPFPDGEEPESHRHGGADDVFASVVFDEEFVRSAAVHEPSAVERMLAADRARAEADAALTRPGGGPADDDPYDDAPDGPPGLAPGGRHTGRPGELHGLTRDLDPDDAYGPYGRYGTARGPYRGHARWHRPVAWVLAVVMGIGVIALAFTAVYRGASSGSRQSPAPPPATTGVDAPAGERQAPLPSVSADSEPPVASAVPPRP